MYFQVPVEYDSKHDHHGYFQLLCDDFNQEPVSLGCRFARKLFQEPGLSSVYMAFLDKSSIPEEESETIRYNIKCLGQVEDMLYRTSRRIERRKSRFAKKSSNKQDLKLFHLRLKNLEGKLSYDISRQISPEIRCCTELDSSGL